MSIESRLSRISFASIVFAAVFAAASVGPSSGYAQESDSSDTLEERLAAIERELASLDTRLEARTAVGTPLGPPDLAMTKRLVRLEQQLAALSADLRRLDQQIQTAMRDANEARREAVEAARLAREVNSRVR